MTLNDLKKITGYSVSTLSKAFNGSDEIPENTRNKIFIAAEKHGVLNKYAKKTCKKKIISAIVPEFISEAYASFIALLDRAAEKYGAILTVAQDNFSTDKKRELIEFYSDYGGADGIIAFDVSFPIKKGMETPLVSIGLGSDPSLDCVSCDAAAATTEALRYLKDCGHKRIAFIGEKLTERRLEYCVRAASEVGLSLNKKHIIVSNLRFEEAGRHGVDELLKSSDMPAAFVCAYDYIAIGAIKALSERGYKVPDDFSVLGTDNISVASYLNSPLATIDTHADELCGIAFDIIMKKLKNKYYRTHKRIVIQADFLPRGTIGKAIKVNPVRR